MFIINLLAIPEIFISLNSLIILLISVFLKKQSFKFSLYASIVILVCGIFLIIANIDNSYFNYKYLFSSNPFINIFKILVVI